MLLAFAFESEVIFALAAGALCTAVASWSAYSHDSGGATFFAFVAFVFMILGISFGIDAQNDKESRVEVRRFAGEFGLRNIRDINLAGHFKAAAPGTDCEYVEVDFRLGKSNEGGPVEIGLRSRKGRDLWIPFETLADFNLWARELCTSPS